MKEIPWERTADGVSAQLAGAGELVMPVLALLTTTQAKMTELNIVSADFRGRTFVFIRRVGVYLEREATAEFLGLYVAEQEEEEEAREQEQLHDGPPICLRYAYWKKRAHAEQFRAARSMRAYVEADQNIDSHLLFLPAAESPRIISLAEELQQLARQGIHLQARKRLNVPWQWLELELGAGSFSYSFTYLPQVEQAEVLEPWVLKWQDAFAVVDFSGGLLPDHGCFISYPSSVLERIARFPEMSFEHFQRRNKSRK